MGIITNVFSEVLRAAIAGPNLVWTVLLSLCLIYWLFVIIGAFDIDALDIDADIDMDADADIDGFDNPGLLIGIFKFLNLDSVPFMVFFSIFSLIAWTLSLIYTNHLGGGLVTTLVLLIPNILFSLIGAKLITAPMAPLFRNLNSIATEIDITGEIALVVHGFKKGELSQAEIKKSNENLLINIRIAEESDVDEYKKGDKVTILRKRIEKDVTMFEVITSI